MSEGDADAWVRAGWLAACGDPKKVARWAREGPPVDVTPPEGWRRALERRGLVPWVPPPGPAAVLLVRGVTPGPGVAVVGARASDAYGLAVARRAALDAVLLGRWVVSGGASGCDAAAHTAALEAGGRTVVVLGGGHDHPYPSVHRPLFDAVVASGGAVVSPFWPTTSPARYRFLFRNGVIAGLSEVVVLARAKRRSGALSTARAGLAQGKAVMVVPGDVGQALSGGAHALLGAGALPLFGAEGLAEALGLRWGDGGDWPVGHGGSPAPWAARESVGAPVEPDAGRVIAALKLDSALDLDELLVRTGLTSERLAGLLLDLELGGMIARLPGDRFAANAT